MAEPTDVWYCALGLSPAWLQAAQEESGLLGLIVRGAVGCARSSNVPWGSAPREKPTQGEKMEPEQAACVQRVLPVHSECAPHAP